MASAEHGVARLHFDIRRASDKLVPGTVPAWVRRDGNLGSAILWEQRFWMHELGVRDAKVARSKEQQHDLRGKLSRWFNLGRGDWSRPTDGEEAPQTILLSSRSILAWLLHKRASWADQGYADEAHKASHLIRQYISVCKGAMNELPTDCLPALIADGLDMPFLRGGSIDCAAFFEQFEDFEDEWHAFRAADATLQLGRFGPEPDIGEFLMYLDARVRASEDADCTPDSWLNQLRANLVEGLAFLAEAAVMQHFQDEIDDGKLRRPTELLGKKGARRVRNATLTKLEVIELLARDGSSNVAANAVQNTHGTAALVRRIMNDMYTRNARALMIGHTAVFVNWDQSTHGGMDVNVALLTDCHRDVGCCLRPVALQTINTYHVNFAISRCPGIGDRISSREEPVGGPVVVLANGCAGGLGASRFFFLCGLPGGLGGNIFLILFLLIFCLESFFFSMSLEVVF